LIARLVDATGSEQQLPVTDDEWNELESMSIRLKVKLSALHQNRRLVHIHRLANPTKLLQKIGIVLRTVAEERSILSRGDLHQRAKDSNGLTPNSSGFWDESLLFKYSCSSVEPINDRAVTMMEDSFGGLIR
jgi:hypothetical protein